MFDTTHKQLELQYTRLIEDVTATLKLEKEKLLSTLTESLANSKKQMCSYAAASLSCERHLESLSEACQGLSAEDSQKVTLTRATEVKPLTTRLTKSKTE